jgi:hypothetical protein
MFVGSHHPLIETSHSVLEQWLVVANRVRNIVFPRQLRFRDAGHIAPNAPERSTRVGY